MLLSTTTNVSHVSTARKHNSRIAICACGMIESAMPSLGSTVAHFMPLCVAKVSTRGGASSGRYEGERPSRQMWTG